jgi:hypothetical protein
VPSRGDALCLYAVRSDVPRMCNDGELLLVLRTRLR